MESRWTATQLKRWMDQSVKLAQTVQRRLHSPEGGAKSPGGACPESKVNSFGELPAMGSVPADQIPRLNKAPPESRGELLRRKMEACAVVYDFSGPDLRGREAKRRTLLELVEYVRSTRGCFDEALARNAASMFAANAFRAVRGLSSQTVAPQELSGPGPRSDDLPCFDSSWPHLDIVYRFFLLFASDVGAEVAGKVFDRRFMGQLLELFGSEDPRERDHVKVLLQRIYDRFPHLRPSIRLAVQHALCEIIQESAPHNGVGDILDFSSHMIHGFALPLKDEHKDFLFKALVPLQKSRSLESFERQLSYCMALYVGREPQLARDVIAAQLRYWPVSDTAKQVLFLNRLEETLEIMPPSEFPGVQEDVARRIALCVEAPQHQVAERALLFWSCDNVAALINDNRRSLFPILTRALYSTSRLHWSSTIRGLAIEVVKRVEEADPQLCDECMAKAHAEEDREEARERTRSECWALLQGMHDDKWPGVADA